MSPIGAAAREEPCIRQWSEPKRSVMRKSIGLLVILASAGLASGAVSQPVTGQPLPSGLQRGPDAFVMLAGSAKPYRPTVNPRNFCPAPGHCYEPPRPPTVDHRYKPEVRDHRTAVAKRYRPTVDNPRPPRQGSYPCTAHCGPKPEVRDHRKPPVVLKGPF
jgi:hypothetical protein